ACEQSEGAGFDGGGPRLRLAAQGIALVPGEQADAGEPVGMRRRGGDVVQDELPVQQHVIAGQEGLDARIHFHAGLLPEQLAHVAIPIVSGRPKARLRFCRAWLAAPLSRLSRVATTTRRRPSSESVKPPTSAPLRPAIRLTQGASSSTATSGSPA